MKTTTFKTTRIQATTPEEKAIVKSWGSLWQRFGQLERTGRPILLIFGDWSGYRSSQYQITHIDVADHYGSPKQKIAEDFSGTVRFTDNTTMQVWVKKITRAEILQRGFKKRQCYYELINRLVKSGKTYYSVADDIKDEVPAF